MSPLLCEGVQRVAERNRSKDARKEARGQYTGLAWLCWVAWADTKDAFLET